MTRQQKYVLSRTGFYILLAVIAFYLVFPFYWAFRSSITPDNQLFTTPVSYFPATPTTGNYQLVLTNGNFLRALANSAVVAISVTVLSLVIGVQPSTYAASSRSFGICWKKLVSTHTVKGNVKIR